MPDREAEKLKEAIKRQRKIIERAKEVAREAKEE
ncbi:hypothetical protein ES708_25544 [subsurface metagenome]